MRTGHCLYRTPLSGRRKSIPRRSGGPADGPPAEAGLGGRRTETDFKDFVPRLGAEAVDEGLHGILVTRKIFSVNEVGVGVSAGRIMKQGDEIRGVRSQ